MASPGKVFTKILDWLAAFLLVVMTGFVFFQVINRYMLGITAAWTEEVSRIFFIYITFLGAYIALRMNAHISIETFVKKYWPPKKFEALSHVLTFLLLYFMGYLLWASLKVLPSIEGATTPVLEVSFLYVHAIIPIVTAMMLLFLITKIFHMGGRQMARMGFLSIGIVAAIFLIFGVMPYGGLTLVLVGMVGMALLILLGMPIVFAMGIACALFLLLFKDYPSQILHTRMIGGIDSFPLLAVPFFILAGELLNTGGVTARLVALAKVLVGSIRGGLGMVTMIGEYFSPAFPAPRWPMYRPSGPSWSRH